MPKRWSKSDRTEKNRKQRKQRWMNARNAMRAYPDCAYNGDFYCNHVYDPAWPWVWVDFRFFHTKLKKYFAVAMVTAEYEVAEQIRDDAYELANFPPMPEPFMVPCEKHGKYGQLYKLNPGTPEYREQYREAAERHKTLQKELASKPTKVIPRIEIKDYGSVAVGVYATVNTQHIDEHYIRDFIKFFRSLGEPTQPGWKWEGEAVEVIAARLYEETSSS